MEPTITCADALACFREGITLSDQGYQGSIRVGEISGRKVLLKSVAGGGLAAWIRRRMLRHEYSIYRRLEGVHGVPRCYGLFSARHLVLEYLEAPNLRHATIRDRVTFFAELQRTIKSIHERGIAHGDLKRKANILVVDGSHPYIVDFGTAVHLKPGFHPFNRFRFGFSRQHDLNAWLKQKYGRNVESMVEEDAEYFAPMWIERAARKIRPAWKMLTRPIGKA